MWICVVLTLVVAFASPGHHATAFLQGLPLPPPPSSSSSSSSPARVTSLALAADGGGTIGTVAILLPSDGAQDRVLSKFGAKSPVDRPPVWDAAVQLARKTTHFSVGGITTELVLVPRQGQPDFDAVMNKLQHQIDAIIALGLQSDGDLQFAETLFENRRNNDPQVRMRQSQFALDCAKELSPLVGPHDDQNPSVLGLLIPWTQVASAKRMRQQMQGLFDRWTTDDYAVAIMLFFNQFSGTQIDWVKHSIDATWEKGPVQNALELSSMISNCGDCIVKCVQDENCKECLDRLTEIDTRDQVASYRTIVSYESDLLRDFSFCILQKNNIFNCDAVIPTMPRVQPITQWRGKPLTRKDGWELLIGHLDDEAAPEVRAFAWVF
jgi:hypothetical protein